ncbi:hypothetical protein ACM66B_002560 [Microbotryomycetes sp. NB124-2]
MDSSVPAEAGLTSPVQLERAPSRRSHSADGLKQLDKPLPPVERALLSSSPNPQNSDEALASSIEWKTSDTPLDSTNSSSTTDTGLPADLSVLPLSPLPHHLAPYLRPTSGLSEADKRSLFTSVYLRSASSGTADTLEWLLSIPDDEHGSLHGSNGHPSNNIDTSQARVVQHDDLPDSPSLQDIRAQIYKRRVSTATASIFTQEDESMAEKTVRERERATEERAWQARLPVTCARKWIDVEARDQEGNSALGLCVALGHAEGVRVLVEAGVDIGGTDRAGWTPLHWAVQNNDIPIAAYLLNHGASPLRASLKGLTPRDLVKRGDEGAAMRDVLRSAFEAAQERERQWRSEDNDHIDEDEADGRPLSRSSFISSSTTAGWMSMPEKVEEQRREQENKRKMELARESARNLEVDFGVLGVEPSPVASPHTSWPATTSSNAPEAAFASITDDDNGPPPSPFIWDACQPDQMLVFALEDLGVMFDVVITNMKPVRKQPHRSIPANVIFLSARFAHYFGSRDLLEELIVGAMERIEAAVHHRPHDMANCAFWLSNSLLLLYYLRKEPNLARATHDLQTHLRDLINEIFVFIIRDAERRIDKVLEAAILEHEPLPGFEDVRFEDEWSGTRFVKKLTGGSRRKAGGMSKSTSAMSLFSSVSSSNVDPTGVDGFSGSAGEPTPQNVTSLLSSTLFILQLYDIPPSIIVQAFSQLFYWIACEVFNRLLTQRKYLCRSRAMQIRLNASALEDWARSNRFPTKMVSVHFAPLNHMLQWLQCLSSESSVDGLISTIQSLRSLNPMQLRRAAREYRYEVDETHLAEDCAEYLQQLQRQWERMRINKTTEGLAPPTPTPDSVVNGAASPASTSSSSAREDVEKATRMIDEVFKDSSSFGTYTPPGASESLGELLNSRYMLPFAVPSSAEMLLNLTSQDSFGPFANVEPRRARSSTSGRTLHHSQSAASIASVASSRRGGDSAVNSPDASSVVDAATVAERERPEVVFAPVLPDDFFSVLDRAKSQALARARMQREAETGLPLSDRMATATIAETGQGGQRRPETLLPRSTSSTSATSALQHHQDHGDEALIEDDVEVDTLAQIEQQRRRESEWRGLGFGAEVAAAEGYQGKWYDWRDGMPRGDEEDEDGRHEDEEGESTEGDESMSQRHDADRSVELFDAEASESGSDLVDDDDDDEAGVHETPRPRDGFAETSAFR